MLILNCSLVLAFWHLPLQFLFEGITHVLLLTFFSSSSFCLFVLLPLFVLASAFLQVFFHSTHFLLYCLFLFFVLLQVSLFIFHHLFLLLMFLHLLLELIRLLCISLSGGRDRKKNYVCICRAWSFLKTAVSVGH